MSYKLTKLKNGLIVASDLMPSLETVSIGIYVRTGSRAENAKITGAAHFLEHMAFKGTLKRTAEQIATEVESVGGQMNAYTSRETTAYHLKILKEDLPLAIDILADIIQNSTFKEDEMEKERQVILQEIKQTLDEPDEMLFENLQSLNYGEHAMGQSILGTEKTVKSIKMSDLKTFMAQHYGANNMVLSACGNVDHEQLVKLAEEHFSGLSKVKTKKNSTPVYNAGKTVTHKELEQVHLALSYNGMQVTHPQYYAANVWSSILGGGMSSRLFQEVREKRGLVYSIHTYISSYSDCGTFGVYAGTSAEHAHEVLSAIRAEITNLQKNVTMDELNRAKASLVASVRMAQESSDARMERLAKNLFIYKQIIPLQEIIDKINAVTLKDVKSVGKLLSDPKTEALSVYGPWQI